MTNQNKAATSSTYEVKINSNRGSTVFTVVSASKDDAVIAAMQNRYGDIWQNYISKVKIKVREKIITAQEKRIEAMFRQAKNA